MNYRILALVFISGIVSLCSTTQSTHSFSITNTFPISQLGGGWDYLALSPVKDWIYVSHGTQVNVINKNNGDSIAVIENTLGVHGIAFDVSQQKGFISNGRLNTVTVFDINSNKALSQIPTGQNPDAILYDAFSKKIITCNGRSKNISIIDPVQNKLSDSIEVGGKPETAVSDGNGKLYINIEDKNEIVVVDTKAFKVISRWSIAPGDGPTGLAFDPETKRLFAGCDKLLVIIDASNGNIVEKIAIGAGCDGVAFDAVTKNIFTSNGEDGTLTVIHEKNAKQYVVLENVPTKKGARTLTLDQQTHLVYLPTAEFEPASPQQKGRPAVKPGSFQLLVVSNKTHG
jgi:DNA-binding beta-propeller fold protein YncE